MLGWESASRKWKCRLLVQTRIKSNHYRHWDLSRVFPERVLQWSCGHWRPLLLFVSADGCLCAVLTFCWHLFWFCSKCLRHTRTYTQYLPNKCQSKVGSVDFCSLVFLCELKRCWRETVGVKFCGLTSLAATFWGRLRYLKLVCVCVCI